MGQAEPRRPHADRDGPRDPLDQRGQGVDVRGRGAAHRLGRRRLPRLPVAVRASTASTPRTRSVTLGQFERDQGRTCARCATSPRSSTTAPASSCTRSSPTARSGTARTCAHRPGHERGRVRLQHGRDRQVPGRRRADLALDRRRRASATRCSTSRGATSSTCARELDEDGDGWPEGNGNVERPGHGRGEARQRRLLHPRASTTTPTWRAPRARRPTPTRRRRAPTSSRRGSRPTWWMEAEGAYADSLHNPGDVKTNQKHWIGADPMEAELYVDGEFVPGLASFEHGTPALATRENNCYSGERPGNRGLFHTGCGGGPAGRGRVRHLLARHRRDGRRRGQLRPARRRRSSARYTDANAETQFSQPATAGTPDEQPGAMPEIFPSSARRRRADGRHAAEHRPLLDLPVDVHAGLGPLRHGLGGRPPAARRAAGPRPRPARGRAAGAARAAERARARTSASATARPTCTRRTTAAATRR